MRALLAAVAAAACLTLPAGAMAQAPPGPRTETASSGAVTATLTYTVAAYSQATGTRLAVTRAGVPARLDGDLREPCKACGVGAIPVGGIEGSEAPSLQFADLAGDGEPEILVSLFTGGAHCCSVLVLYGWDPATSRYRRLARNFGDPGFAVRDVGGGPALVTADDRFAYAFCAYACSSMPPQVLRYRAFHLIDVTASTPGIVRADLRAQQAALRTARRHRQQGWTIKGILPAMCADLYLLHRGAQCRRSLQAALRHGELRRRPGDLAPADRRYVRDVLAFLKKTGYR